MGQFVKVARVSELAPGQGKTVEGGGVEMALFNVGGTFRALGNACCHRGGPLGDGELDGTTVTCPWHGWQYDVVTGTALRNDEVSVPTYRVEVRGEDVFVELP
jgi:nitrite reductase/ring-hydroxylating ferredoxin subunit